MTSSTAHRLAIEAMPAARTRRAHRGRGATAEHPGDRPGVDDRRRPVHERHQVGDEHRDLEPGLDGEAGEVERGHPHGESRDECRGEQWRRGEPEAPPVRAEVDVAEAGEDERQERRGEGGAAPRKRFVGRLHRG